MTQNEHPLARVAERGDPRGAEDVLRAARLQAAGRHPAGGPWLAAAAAAAAVVVGAVIGAGVLLGDEGQSDVRAADRGPDDEASPAPTSDPPASATSTPPGPTPEAVTAFGFSSEEGVVRLVDDGPDGGTVEPEPIGGVRGEEGSTDLAVAPGADVVFHHVVFSGCLTNLVRTEVGGDSQILVENGAHPALDETGDRLAYASGTQCTFDSDVLVVRNVTTGETVSTPLRGDDGLPFRIADVEWTGERIAVLASPYDVQDTAAQWVLIYTVPETGPPAFDGQLLLGDQSSGTLDEFRYPNIEPVPGDPGSLLRTRSSPAGGGTDLVLVDLSTGDERTLFSIREQMSAFAARTLDDVFYVATQPKVPGRAQVDTVRRRVGNEDVELAQDVNSVALPTP